MGSHATDKNTRRKIRRRLEKLGMDPAEIKRCISEITTRQEMKRRGDLPKDAPICLRIEYVRLVNKKPLEVIDLDEERDDKKFKPSNPDAILTGVGRATGATAKAVKSRKTMTRWEYENMYGVYCDNPACPEANKCNGACARAF